MRLNYEVVYFPVGSPPFGLITTYPAVVVLLHGNYAGVKKIKIDAGAFQDFLDDLGTPYYVFNSIVAGDHDITFKDDYGTRRLATVHIKPVDCDTYSTSLIVDNTGLTASVNPSPDPVNPVRIVLDPDPIDTSGFYFEGTPNDARANIPVASPYIVAGALPVATVYLAPEPPLGSVTCSMNFGRNLLMAELSVLAASISSSNCSAVDADDGIIQVTVTSGSGQYEVRFGAPGFIPDSVTTLTGTNPQVTTRIGLEPNVYPVTVTDLFSGLVVELSATISEPEIIAPTENNTFLFVPALNSLTFVQEGAEPDNCTVFQTMDNTLFCKQKFDGFFWQNYYQKVQQCDTFPLQFLSNFVDHVVELRNYITDALIEDGYDIVSKETNTNQPQIYDIFITGNPDDTTKSRVYFQTPTVPVLVEAGDTFSIINSIDGFNGNYAVVAVALDVLLGKQYIIITKEYTPVPPSVNAKAQFLVSTQDFDVYEFIVPFAAIPEGKYYMKIKGTSGDNPQEWVSEPIDVKGYHALTNLIQYRNFDNAFDMTYSTGITCQRRIESRLFKRFPKGQDDNYRNTDQSIVKLKAKRQRGFLFEFFQLPPYLHEALCVIFGHDFFAVNGKRMQSNEQYDDPNYITRYPMSNSQIQIEQYGWFDKYNSDDIGPVDGVDSGFIIANGGFLKR